MWLTILLFYFYIKTKYWMNHIHKKIFHSTASEMFPFYQFIAVPILSDFITGLTDQFLSLWFYFFFIWETNTKLLHSFTPLRSIAYCSFVYISLLLNKESSFKTTKPCNIYETFHLNFSRLIFLFLCRACYIVYLKCFHQL